jgi:hypothetical protein
MIWTDRRLGWVAKSDMAFLESTIGARMQVNPHREIRITGWRGSRDDSGPFRAELEIASRG